MSMEIEEFMELSEGGMYMVNRGGPSLPTTKLLDQNLTIPIDLLRHLKRLCDLSCDYTLSDQFNLLIRLYEHNIVWIVSSAFVCENFRYAASLNNLPSVVRDNDVVTYEGDIPEFALDNIDKVTALGIQFLTIHSNQPLPTSYRKTDPVVIGWSNNPVLRYDERFTYPIYQTREAFPVVIAAWDYDEEIKL